MSKTEYSGRPVTSLQRMLRTIAQTDQTIPSVLPDGIYGENTKRAVCEIQRQNGMNVTGTTDYDTWNKITELYAAARVETEDAAPLCIVMDPQQVFLPGSTNCHVCLIQAMFSVLSSFYKELADVRVTGVYDDMTQNAVRWLQKACGVPCSGICNKQVWKMLTGLYSLKTGNGKKT